MLLAHFRAVTVYNDALRGDQSELSAWRLSRTRWSLSARQPRMTWPPLASRWRATSIASRTPSVQRGFYPPALRDALRDRLPALSEAEAEGLVTSPDVFGW